MAQFIKNTLADAGEFIDAYLWRLVASAIIILVFLGIKFAVAALIKRSVRKITENRGGREQADAVLKIVLPPVRLLIITAALGLCSAVIGVRGTAAGIMGNALISLVLVALFSALYGACDYLTYAVASSQEKRGQKPYYLALRYIEIIAKVTVVVFGAVSVLQQWDISLSSLVAGFSIGGLALALAAQDTAANIFGAFTVMLEKPFEIGDYIEVAGIAGTVEKMGVRSTRIRQINQALVYVPNSKMTSENITNWRMLSNRRVETRLGLVYSTPSDRIEAFTRVLAERIAEHKEVKDDTVLVNFSDFAASSLDIDVKYHVNTPSAAEMSRVRQEINLTILRTGEEMGIEFAFPTATVHIESENGKVQ